MNTLRLTALSFSFFLACSAYGQKSTEGDFVPLKGVNYVTGASPQIVLNHQGNSWMLLAGRTKTTADGLTVEGGDIAPEAHMTVTQGPVKIKLLPHTFQLSQGTAGG